MRIIVYVLAFIILALSCLPCADGTNAIKQGTVASISNSSSQQQDKGHNDACTPFCHCACCAGFSIIYTYNSIATVPIVCTKEFISYLPANLIEISSPVWQPPKIVA